MRRSLLFLPPELVIYIIMRAHHLLLTLGLSGALFGVALGYVCCSQPNTSRWSAQLRVVASRIDGS